jgi:glycosyltransferase involved in cell wall biosynthesis
VELSPARSAVAERPSTDGRTGLPANACVGQAVPRISIVTPSLNQGAFVEQAIRSVLRQDYSNVELIVVDGGSTDGSAEIIGRYQGRLAHWIRERDSGPANALNKGFERASGDILGFLNADDFLLPGSLAVVAREFRDHPEADVISGHGLLAKASGELGAPIFSDRWNLEHFAHGACVLVQPATFFRRSAFQRIGGFNESTKTCWDMELWADLALAGARFRAVDEFLAAFRLHDRSISGSEHLRRQRRQDALAVRQKMRGHIEAAGDRLYELFHRLRKFSGHPYRTLTQRWFFRSTLHRWSL